MARHSHLYLDVRGRSPDDGAFIQQYQLDPTTGTSNSGRQQEWRLVAVPGTRDEFYLVAGHSGKYLTVHPDPLGVVQVAPMQALDERQRWRLEPADYAEGMQYFRIRTAWAPFQNYYVDVIGRGMHNENTVALWTHDLPGDQQMFAFVPFPTAIESAAPPARGNLPQILSVPRHPFH